MVIHQQVKGMSRDNLLGSLFFIPKPVLTAWDLLVRNIQQGGKTYLRNVMYRIHHSSLHPRFAGHTQTWRLRSGDNPARQRACVCVYRVFISTHAHLWNLQWNFFFVYVCVCPGVMNAFANKNQGISSEPTNPARLTVGSLVPTETSNTCPGYFRSTNLSVSQQRKSEGLWWSSDSR